MQNSELYGPFLPSDPRFALHDLRGRVDLVKQSPPVQPLKAPDKRSQKVDLKDAAA